MHNHITATSTPESLSGISPAADSLENQCKHCLSPWGHRGWCPVINRASAEAWSITEADRIRAKALGVSL